jgi:hypothetical protein
MGPGTLLVLPVIPSLMGISGSSSLQSRSTTGRVMAKINIVGAEIRPMILSHQALSLQLYNVGNKVEASVYGLGR